MIKCYQVLPRAYLKIESRSAIAHAIPVEWSAIFIGIRAIEGDALKRSQITHRKPIVR